MKFIAILLLTFLISQTLLNAEEIYIQVTTATSKKKLRTINKKFKNMSLPMVHKKTTTRYLIYSGPYRSGASASFALERIQQTFPNAKIKTKKKTKEKKSGAYLNIALGFSSAPSTHAVEEGCVIIEEPNNKGISYNIDGGYTLKNGFSIGLGYLRFDATDLLFDNVYGSLNYRFNDYYDYTPYIGVLGGFSGLKWFTDPIDNPLEGSNNDSSSFLFGTQTGIVYNSGSVVSLYLGYQCLFMNHITNITLDKENSSKLKHNTLHTLQIGLHF
ncbi:MAG: hypothetical protein U9P38_06740 [Campylobacterota bacterium]|nr:hypothetical protein [Campylobacterota bacterium]